MQLRILLSMAILTGTSALLPQQAVAATGAEIRQAIELGQGFLRSKQKADGSFQGGYGRRLGAIALGGMALLQTGAAPDSREVELAADYIRKRAAGESQTYDLALSIMFLDQLTRQRPQARTLRQGTPAKQKRLPSGRTLVNQQVDDSGLIEQLGKRLLQGQGPKGCWTYSCRRPVDGDHSNTQFGVLGLWVAGLHGVDTAGALRRTNGHFRSCQSESGGWDYTVRPGQKSTRDKPSMTCAGLIALATALGLDNQLRTAEVDQAGPQADDAVDRAMHLTESYLLAGQAGRPERQGTKDLYFLWSLERVGVLYDLDNIGMVDWHQWGADVLVQSQQADGSWPYMHSSEVGTCFALLFLSRANVSPELTGLLQGKYGTMSAAMRSLPRDADPTQVLSEIAARRSVDPVPRSELADVDTAGLLEMFEAVDDEGAKRDLVAELSQRRPTYAEIKPEIDRLRAMAGSADAAVARVGREQLVNAFQRAPIKHCLWWLGRGDEQLGALIWEQIEGRIDRADQTRLADYRSSALEVIEDDRYPVASKKAVYGLLVRINAPTLVDDLVELLPRLPRELWPEAGEFLRKQTGQDFGPHAGDGIAETVESQKQWQAWRRQKGGLR